MPSSQDDLKPRSAEERRLLEHLLASLRELQFGSIEIIVHEGRVVQFERREKTRFNHHR